MLSAKPSAIKFVVPATMVLGALDSILKEMPWVPGTAKQVAFFALGPLIVMGTIILLPYLRERISIVTPKATSNLVLSIAVVVSGFQAVVWGAMYYNVETVGNASISTMALVLKDVVILSSAVVFGMLGIRLARWYLRTKNKVVLSFGLQAIVTAIFALLHMLADYLPNPTPRIIPDALAASLVVLVWAMYLVLIRMRRVYYGKDWLRNVVPLLVPWGLITLLLVSLRLGVQWDTISLTILLFGFDLGPLGFMLGFFTLVPALPNQTAKEYYMGMGYGLGLYTMGTCGMGLRLLTSFPLSGFASLSMLLPAACLSFATFTSSASYFSISEDVRRRVRQATGFVTSMGEAESSILTEQQVSQFYDRITGLAKASGAVEEDAFSKDEIYKYADALKRIQQTSGAKSLRNTGRS